MDALGARQGLHFTVLREQGDGRRLLARQHVFEVLEQGKARSLDGRYGFPGAQRWLLHEFVYRRFHGAQQQRNGRHAHHFEGTAGLVQLLSRHAQGTCIQRRKVGIPGLFGFVHEAAHRLDGSVQGLAQFLQHPGQGPEVTLLLAGLWRGRVVDIERGHGFASGRDEPSWLVRQRRHPANQAILNRATD